MITFTNLTKRFGSYTAVDNLSLQVAAREAVALWGPNGAGKTTAVKCLLGLLASGIVMWRAYFALYFPIGVIRFASLLHAVCALVLICAIVVHIYAAIWVKGSIRAMTRGTVSPGWAWKHHRAWLRAVTRGDRANVFGQFYVPCAPHERRRPRWGKLIRAEHDDGQRSTDA